MTQPHLLVGLPISPWTIRARWTLDFCRIPYRWQEYVTIWTPLQLRRKLRRPASEITAPFLMTADAPLMEALDIARMAADEAERNDLFPQQEQQALERWCALADEIAEAGRAVMFSRMVSDEAAQMAALPDQIPPFARPVFRFMARGTARYIARKYGFALDATDSHQTRLNTALLELRARLKGPNSSEYLLNGFSYADIAMASSLQLIAPMDHPKVPLKPATREIWTNRALSQDFSDIMAWRDALVASHWPADVHYATCPLCEASCGLEINQEAGKTTIRGDRNNPLSRGYICPKAVGLQDIQSDPDRLRQPLMRTSDGWQEIGWDQAYSIASERLETLRSTHGNDSVGMYLGNPLAHNYECLLMHEDFEKVLGSRRVYSSISCDGLAHFHAALRIFGHFLSVPVPDLEHTGYFLCLGANPAVSNGSFMQAPNVVARMRNISARGGRVVVIDPRRTRSAELADEHHAIIPGTDVYFLAALLHLLFAEYGGAERCRGLPVKGATALAEALATVDIDKMARLCGIATSDIRRIAAEFTGAADGAVAYARMGLATSAESAVAIWLVNLLNIVSGNLDRPGGAMFATPAVDVPGLSAVIGGTGSLGRWHSAPGGLPEFNGQLPAVTIADACLATGDDRMRGLIVYAGNPILSVPGGQQIERGLKALDYMISIDYYLNETSRHADLILPPCGPLEKAHYPLSLAVAAVHNTAKFTPPMLTPDNQMPPDWKILTELGLRMSPGRSRAARAAQRRLRAMQKSGPEKTLDLMLRIGPYGHGLPGVPRVLGRILKRLTRPNSPLHNALAGSTYGETSGRSLGLTLAKLKAAPHGIDLGELRPMLDRRIYHSDGRLDLASSDLLSRLRNLLENAPEAPPDGIQLIGRRDLRSNNSWMHNVHRLVKGPDRCVAEVSPEDAHRLGLVNGDEVRLFSSEDSVELPVAVVEGLRPGVVSVPHGWGHNGDGLGLSVASARPGVNINRIIPAGRVETLTGTAILNGVPLKLEKV